MLHLIKGKLGTRVAQLITEQFIVDRARNDRDQQFVPLRAQLGASHEGLIKVAELMEIPVFGFWRNLVSATVGAVIIITVYRAIRGRSMRY